MPDTLDRMASVVLGGTEGLVFFFLRSDVALIRGGMVTEVEIWG